jgi:hypothetical protein
MHRIWSVHGHTSIAAADFQRPKSPAEAAANRGTPQKSSHRRTAAIFNSGKLGPIAVACPVESELLVQASEADEFGMPIRSLVSGKDPRLSWPPTTKSVVLKLPWPMFERPRPVLAHWKGQSLLQSTWR